MCLLSLLCKSLVITNLRTGRDIRGYPGWPPGLCKPHFHGLSDQAQSEWPLPLPPLLSMSTSWDWRHICFIGFPVFNGLTFCLTTCSNWAVKTWKMNMAGCIEIIFFFCNALATVWTLRKFWLPYNQDLDWSLVLGCAKYECAWKKKEVWINGNNDIIPLFVDWFGVSQSW